MKPILTADWLNENRFLLKGITNDKLMELIKVVQEHTKWAMLKEVEMIIDKTHLDWDKLRKNDGSKLTKKEIMGHAWILIEYDEELKQKLKEKK